MNKARNRNFWIGTIVVALVVVFLLLLDVHGFANHLGDRWP